MPISRTRTCIITAAAVALAIVTPRFLAGQERPAGDGIRTRIDVIPMAGYAHGTGQSRDAFTGGVRIGLRTETWGIALTELGWTASWRCPSTADEVCDDPVSSTLGVDRRFTRPDGTALIAGADAGVMSWYGARAMGDVRVGVEQPVSPTAAIRIEGQAQKVLGIDIATLAALVGFRFSFGGPRLRHG